MIAPSLSPVQLCLELRTKASRTRVSVTGAFRSYWDQIDLADVGGELHARRPRVKALLTADPRSDGSWIGYHDLVLGSGGSSGPTRPQTTRVDALVSAAYMVVKHCDAVLAQNGTAPRSDARAARQLLRWLRQLDLL
jgi:hypothetical protein